MKRIREGQRGQSQAGLILWHISALRIELRSNRTRCADVLEILHIEETIRDEFMAHKFFDYTEYMQGSIASRG